MRTDLWRYTEWVNFDYTTSTPLWNTSHGVELYSHRGDPTASASNPDRRPKFGNPASFDDFENENLAGHPDLVAIQAQLSRQLRAGPWGPHITP